MIDVAERESLMSKIPLIVDVDAHVVEPPDVWWSRLPAKYRDIGPHIEYLPPGEPKLDGGAYIEAPGTEGEPVAWWIYEDHQYSVKRLIAAAGYPTDAIGMQGITYDDMRPGCWQPAARVEDNAGNGVEAQLCFPNYPRFCGQLFLRGNDRELARLCVEAYNDWMVEEWCGTSGGHLLPLCLVPMWDADLAAAEVRRNAVRGVPAVAFSELPPYLGLPSMTDFLLSGVFERFPRLKIMYAEAQIGWIPYLLERVDDVWETHRGWNHGHDHCPERPSSYYTDHVFSCFFKDAVGVEMLHRVGEDNVMFETDYPHQDGTWPQSVKAAAEQFGHLPDGVVRKLARGNAIALFDLDLEA